MASTETLNELYNILDIYIVSSRLEGGPQAILESAITKTPIISSDVGVASQILNQNHYLIQTIDLSVLYQTLNLHIRKLKNMKPAGFKEFISLLSDLYERHWFENC